ncbi:MAG: BLUF domain-containing protein [Betaproteobacteria bacterium]|nr:BLUF domain-containing protein [Betaproteobacteria bacterium]
MTRLRCVVYVSTATRLMSEEDLELLLRDARAFNESVGITGILLYNDGTFFQYFEGPEDAVERVYDRIRASHAHKDLTELLRAAIPMRLFGSWTMGFTHPPASQLLMLMNWKWRRDAERLQQSPSCASEGLELLRNFWATAQRAA